MKTLGYKCSDVRYGENRLFDFFFAYLFILLWVLPVVKCVFCALLTIPYLTISLAFSYGLKTMAEIRNM